MKKRLVIKFGLVLFTFVGCADDKEQKSYTDDNEQKIYAREEFSKIVMGCDASQLLLKLRKPIFIQKGPDGPWVYSHITINPETNKPDKETSVYMKNGKADSVSYDP